MNIYKNAALWIIKVGLFIVPFIPLYIAGSLFFPFITGKAFLFRIIVEIVFAAWLFLVLAYKEYRPKKSLLFIALGVFMGVVVLAMLLGVNPVRSFWSNFERMEGVIAYLHLFAYFLVLAHTFGKKEWLTFFNFFVSAGLIENIYALSQKLGYMASPQGGFRVDGTIGNPGYLAAYLTFVLALCFLVLFQKTAHNLKAIQGWTLVAFTMFFFQSLRGSGVKLVDAFHLNPVFLGAFILFIALFAFTFRLKSESKVWKYYYAAIALFSVAIIYLTATRGAILGLFVGSILAGLLYLLLYRAKTSREKTSKKIVAGIALLLIIAGVSVKMFRESSFIKESQVLSRLASISLSQGEARFAIWKMGWRGFKERPILGWGPENYLTVFSKQYDPVLYGQESWFDRSHNIIFDWLINAGIVGLLSYLSIFAAVYVLLWRRFRGIQKSGDGEHGLSLPAVMTIAIALFVYFIQNIFIFDQFGTYIGFFAILAYVHNRSVVQEPSEKKADGKGWDEYLVLGPVVIVLAALIYGLNYRPLQVNLNLLEGLKNSNDPEVALGYFEKALTYNTMGDTEAREQLGQFALNVITAPSVDAKTKDTVFNKAVAAIQESAKKNKLDPRPLLFLGMLHREAGLYDESIRFFKQAFVLTPRKQQVLFDLGNTYIQKKDYGEAVNVLKEAFEENTNFIEARNNLIVAYILNKEQAKADELLIEYYKTVDAPVPLLGQVYLSVQNFQRNIGVWKALVATNDQNAVYHAKLGEAYGVAGKISEALKELDEAVRLDPSLKPEIDRFAEQLKAAR